MDNTVDIGEYCRSVEDHLTRGNGGHLVRIVGPGFQLVRGWAEEGIPLSIVCRGIDQKIERHHAGQAQRPLRIEFCEGDVRQIYDNWRRAIGVVDRSSERDSANGSLPESSDGTEVAERRRPSLGKQLDRALERLTRAAGRLERTDSFRDGAAVLIERLSALREPAKASRGPARDEVTAQLPALDAQLVTLAREGLTRDELDEIARLAEQDLEGYRDRLSAGAWQRALDATIDRLARERLGLPTLEIA